MAVSIGWIIIIFAFHREHLNRNEHIVVATVSWISYLLAHFVYLNIIFWRIIYT